MAIIDIESASVSVSHFSDLKTVLEDYAAYAHITTVYLAADITISDQISIAPQREHITLDGRNPSDATGETVHTVTDFDTPVEGKVIGVRTAPATHMQVTYSHICWIGKNNYYGIFFVHNTVKNITAIFDHVTYTGPQLTYHAHGITRLVDCVLVSRVEHEGQSHRLIGEVGYLEIGGATEITQESATYSIIHYWKSKEYSCVILPDADIHIHSCAYLLDMTGTNPLSLQIGQRAKLDISLRYSLCKSDDALFDSIAIGENASFRLRQQQSHTVPTIRMAGELRVENGARVDLQQEQSGSAPLIQYYGTNRAVTPALAIHTPASFVLRTPAGTQSRCLGVDGDAVSVAVSIAGQQLNAWGTAADSAIAGTLDDHADFSWYKNDSADLVLTGSMQGARTSLTANLTAEEERERGHIGLLDLQAQGVLSVGRVPLAMEPILASGEPIRGKSAPHSQIRVAFITADEQYNRTQTALDDGSFSFATAFPIPVGTDVAVTAGTPYLIHRSGTQAVDAGTLRLLEPVPETLEFLFSPVARNPHLYRRSDPDWRLQVLDSRVNSTPWRLYATVDGVLTSYDAEGNARETLPGALVFVDSENALHPFGQEPIAVWQGAPNSGRPLTTTVAWAPDKGMLMTVSAQPFHLGKRYTATVRWHVAPVSE